MRFRRRLITGLLLLTLGGSHSFASSKASPEDVLSGHGLHEEDGKWILPEQRRLLRLLGRVDQQLREVHKSASQWRKEIESVESLKEQLARLDAQYNENRKRLSNQSLNLLLQQQLQEQQGRLSRRLGELRLALKQKTNEEASPLYKAAQSYALARGELGSAVATIQELHAHIWVRHQSLVRQTDIQRALSELSTAGRQVHHLASVEGLRKQVDETVKQAARALETNELPLLVTGRSMRIGVTLDGVPVTFVLHDEEQETLLPLGQLERLRIPTPGESQWKATRYAEREIRGAHLRISSVRFGNVTLRDVPVMITSTEEADLGARLGSQLLDQLDWKVDLEGARLLVRAREPDRGVP